MTISAPWERGTATAAVVGCTLNGVVWVVLGAVAIFFAWFLVPLGVLWFVLGSRIHRGSSGAAAVATVAGTAVAAVQLWALLGWRDREPWQDVEPVIVAIQLVTLVLGALTAALAIPRARPAYRRLWEGLCGDL